MVLDSLSPIIRELSILVGGVFGIYVILVIVRIYYERKKLTVLEDMRYALDQQNHLKHLPISRERPTPWRRFKKLFKKQ